MAERTRHVAQSLKRAYSDEIKTLPYDLASIDDADDVKWGKLIAGSTMSCMPRLLLLAFLSKYFMRGLSMEAVKS